MKQFLLFVTLLGLTSTINAQQQSMLLWYDHPAQFFEESLPMGNGKLGALVYGGTKNDTIYLNDITYWTGKPVNPNEGTGKSVWIPRIREALFAENYRLADSLQHYVQGEQSASYQPLATFNLINLTPGAIQNYRRELNIDSAMAHVSYQQDGVTYKKEYFVSHSDSLIAIRITADKPGKVNFKISLTAQVPHKTKASDGQLTMIGHATGKENETIHACTIVRLTHKEGQDSHTDSTLTVENADEATLYIVNATSFNGFNKHPVDDGADYMNNAIDAAWHTKNFTYNEFKQRHINAYQRLYQRLNLQLGHDKYDNNIPTDELLKKYSTPHTPLSVAAQRYLETLYFQFGRYLLLSCSRTPGVPANLQGLWTPYLFSPWRGNYTMNINLEENYWPANSTNISETIQPLFSFLKGLAANGKYTAHNFYGVNEGWCASHNSDIWCKTAPVGEGKESPEWANWNLGGAWLVNTLWDYYLYTQDYQTLKSTIYPLMEGASRFCEQWLIENPKHPGELITAPSTSPENEYLTDKGYHGTTCYGGTADLAIIRELFENTQQARRILNIKPDKQLNNTLKRLHPYTIGSDGDLNEWYYDWKDYDPQHRHQSHLIGLYPGMHLQRHAIQAKDSSLLIAAKQTLIQKGDESTGWSTGWRINLWARLGDGKHAYEIYHRLLSYVSPEEYHGPDAVHRGGTYPNLFDAHPPFQIDGNFGGTAGVCEMLAQSTLEIVNNKPVYYIHLLPALPHVWKDGEINGLKTRGGLTVDMQWKDHQVYALHIKADADVTINLHYNYKTDSIKRLKKGQEILFRAIDGPL